VPKRLVGSDEKTGEKQSDFERKLLNLNNLGLSHLRDSLLGNAKIALLRAFS
jgi:hypothetical protein